jgi:hypothetical protein
MKQPSEWVEKCWGRTRELIDSPLYSKHELELVAGGYCSIHYHRVRANRFHLTEGSVEIVQFFGPTFTRHMLGPDNIFDVASLVPHMFIVHKNGRMYEEYYSDRGGVVEREDIVRLIEGGNVENLNLKELTRLPSELLSQIM